MSGSAACDRVMEYASSYLDRRLSVAARSKYDQHLARCPSCQSEVALLQEVSRRAAALPIPPTPHGLADRIRATARTSGSARAPWWSGARVVAAVLVAGLTIVGAYLVGVREGQRRGAPADDAPAETARANRSPASTPGHLPDQLPDQLPNHGQERILRPVSASVSDSDAQSLRAAQGLLADLALIDQVPAELRRPLLQAQLDHFGLDDWARRRGDVAEFLPIANVLRHLETTLRDAPDDLRLADLQQEARTGALWQSFEEARGLPAPGLGPIEDDPHLRYLALDLGPEVGDESRRSLGALMQIKDSWVHGRHHSVIQSLQESRPRSASMRSLGPSLPFVAGASFADVGLPQRSEDMLDPLAVDAHGWMRSMMDSFLGDGDRARDAANLEQRLHELLLRNGADGADGEREIHVEEDFEDGSYSYRVTIRSASTSSGAASRSTPGSSTEGSGLPSADGDGPGAK